MNRNLTVFLLGSYFFCYAIPQYIPNLFYVYDRIAAQLLFLTILNIIAFYLIIRKNTFKQFFSTYKSKYHFLLIPGICSIFFFFSLVVAENLTEGLVSLTKVMTFFLSFIIIFILISKSKN